MAQLNKWANFGTIKHQAMFSLKRVNILNTQGIIS